MIASTMRALFALLSVLLLGSQGAYAQPTALGAVTDNHDDFDIVLPHGWSKVAEREGYLAFQAPGAKHQLSFSMARIDPAEFTLESFTQLFDIRLAGERAYSSALEVDQPRAAADGFVAEFRGEDVAGRRFSGRMSTSSKIVMTIYLESLEPSGDHSAIFDEIARSMRLN